MTELIRTGCLHDKFDSSEHPDSGQSVSGVHLHAPDDEARFGPGACVTNLIAATATLHAPNLIYLYLPNAQEMHGIQPQARRQIRIKVT